MFTGNNNFIFLTNFLKKWWTYVTIMSFRALFSSETKVSYKCLGSYKDYKQILQTILNKKQ